MDTPKLTPVQFTHKAIEALRDGQYKGIHSVYSGFNAAFRKYFGTDPVAATKQLVADGQLVVRFARGGAILYKPGEAPEVQDAGAAKGDKALTSILG